MNIAPVRLTRNCRRLLLSLLWLATSFASVASTPPASGSHHANRQVTTSQNTNGLPPRPRLFFTAEAIHRLKARIRQEPTIADAWERQLARANQLLGDAKFIEKDYLTASTYYQESAKLTGQPVNLFKAAFTTYQINDAGCANQWAQELVNFQPIDEADVFLPAAEILIYEIETAYGDSIPDCSN